MSSDDTSWTSGVCVVSLRDVKGVFGVCRRGEARPRGFHLLQRSGWEGCSDRRRLEHDARLLRRHSYRKF